MEKEYFVYILQSLVFKDKLYIGHTDSLAFRLKRHNDIKNKGWTKKYQPWRILFSNTFSTRADAMKEEKRLKSFKNRASLLQHLKIQL